MTDEKVGRFCETHQRWAPDGACCYCVPERAKAPELAIKPRIADWQKCGCGRYMFDTRSSPLGSPLSGIDSQTVHTPERCTPHPFGRKIQPAAKPTPDVKPLTFMGPPVVVDPTMKHDDEIRVVIDETREIEKTAQVRCACGRFVLASGFYCSLVAGVLMDIESSTTAERHAFDRCEIHRKDQPPRSG